jgi:hypothetical protein
MQTACSFLELKGHMHGAFNSMCCCDRFVIEAERVCACAPCWLTVYSKLPELLVAA